MDRLYDKLIAYHDQDYYPMHMPGHKRNTDMLQMINPYAIDITEIEGFDNLHQAEGVLRELSERLSKLYHAGRSFPLVNGSTVGILAGISATTVRGDKVLMARNCHKSVYHAISLKGLKPIYYYPPRVGELSVYGGISSLQIEELLIKNKNISLVVITSPTYEGVISDIKAISEVTHRYGAILMVDEAHGAHLGFHEGFPESSVRLGADIVIQSLHKTLPAFTQTAVLHSNRDDLNSKIEQYLTIYESSSPSYLLLAGLDRCISMLEDRVKELFHQYIGNLNEFYKEMKELKNLKLLGLDVIGQYGIYKMDPSKITISVQGTPLSGHQIRTILREKYHIIMEMETPDYVLAMTSICDTKEGFTRLSEALIAIDEEITELVDTIIGNTSQMIQPTLVILPGEAVENKSEQILLNSSCGRVSATYVCMYPPGSPLLVPGERIDQEMIDYIKVIQQMGITVTGLSAEMKDEIAVVKGICINQRK